MCCFAIGDIAGKLGILGTQFSPISKLEVQRSAFNWERKHTRIEIRELLEEGGAMDLKKQVGGLIAGDPVVKFG